jgi:hypothetical protein
MYDELFQYKAGGENGYPLHAGSDSGMTSGSPLNVNAFGVGSNTTPFSHPSNGYQTDSGRYESDTENPVGNIYIPT